MTTQPLVDEIEAVARALACHDDPKRANWWPSYQSRATAAINALSMHRASLSGGGEGGMDRVERIARMLAQFKGGDASDWMDWQDEANAISYALTIPSSPEGGIGILTPREQHD